MPPGPHHKTCLTSSSYFLNIIYFLILKLLCRKFRRVNKEKKDHHFIVLLPTNNITIVNTLVYVLSVFVLFNMHKFIHSKAHLERMSHFTSLKLGRFYN